MVYRVEVVGIPHYADINPPPAGTVLPPNSRAATVSEVENKASTNAVYDAGTDTWIISAAGGGNAGAGTGGGAGTTNGAGMSTGGTVGSGGTGRSTSTASLPEVLVLGKPIPTYKLPNPLNDYASYTYSWALWWLSTSDYSTLAGYQSVSQAQSFEPTVDSSYVIAEDSGLYPDRRLPSTSGLNYHIHSVEFQTTAGHNDKSWHTNLINGTIIIKEPYGVTLLDALVLGSFMGKAAGDPPTNYTDQPYMLELNFNGYDDNGVPIPTGKSGLYRKRFPIKIISIKVEVTGSGTQYKVSFVPLNHVGLHEEYANIPKTMSVSGSKVKDLFNDLSAQLKTFWTQQVDKGKAMYADGLSFEFDPSVGNSSIVYSKGASIAEANPDGITLDLNKKQFTISEGTKIVDLINRVVALSDYVSEQLKEQGGLTSNHTKPLNVFKTMITSQYGATTSGDAISFAVFDPIKNQFPRMISFKVHQFTTWGITHPAVDQGPDSLPYTVKEYNYIYSGQNTDIINLKLNFDTTYYTPVLAYKDIFASYQSIEDAANESKATARGAFNVGPALLAIKYPSLANIPTITPARYVPIVNDVNITTWGGILNDPLAQVSADVFKSLYSGSRGDMVATELTIIGDPHLIRQDDWLVSPSPVGSSDYTNKTSQFDFANKYGFLRFDTADLVVSLNIFTPIDQDADLTARGQMYWAGGSPVPTKSLFSGQYRIILVKNKFEGGRFEQVLKLVRYTNGDFADALAKLSGSRDAVKNSITGQNNKGNS